MCVLNSMQTEMRILAFLQGNENLLIWLLKIIWRVFDKSLKIVWERLTIEGSDNSWIAQLPKHTSKKQNDTLKYFIFVWNHSHIHKYLITTFNKEYITLQGIQTSTFFFEKQNFTASRHPPLSRGLLRSVLGLKMQEYGDGGRSGGGGGSGGGAYCSARRAHWQLTSTWVLPTNLIGCVLFAMFCFMT